MAGASLKLIHGGPSIALPAPALTMAEQLPPGRLVELSGDRSGARFQTAVSILRHAQAQGETTAWIKPSRAPFFAPDLQTAGIDLDSLVIINLPPGAGDFALPRSAEILLRSGALGLIIVDLTSANVRRGDTAWQGRLLTLAREHQSRVVLITEKTKYTESLGPLISIRLEPQKRRQAPGRFGVDPHIVKDKSGILKPSPEQITPGPWGLQ